MELATGKEEVRTDAPAKSNKLQLSKNPQSLPGSPTKSEDSDSGHAQSQVSDASCSSSDSNNQITNDPGDNNSMSDQCFVDALSDNEGGNCADTASSNGSPVGSKQRSQQRVRWLNDTDDDHDNGGGQMVKTNGAPAGTTGNSREQQTIDNNLDNHHRQQVDNTKNDSHTCEGLKIDLAADPVSLATTKLSNKDCSSSSLSSYSSSLSSSSSASSAPLSERLENTKLILSMALNNEFAAALAMCERSADTELYASLANAVLSFLKVALTLEPADLQAAVVSINRSFDLSTSLRKRTNMLSRLLYRPNYNQDYSDEEIHAELVHAESLLLLSLISFIADQSLMCLVRGALRIRACYQHYKECLLIMEKRTNWQSDEARRHFESGVRMGYGIFNLLMSYLPRKVLRLLEYVGFSGNRSIAVDELDKSIDANDGLRSVFSALVILTHQTYIDNIFGLGDYDLLRVERLLHERFESQYPKSAFYLLFRARYYQMLGNLTEALHTYQKCIDSQSDWKSFHSICHWEMMWCYTVQLDWPKAAHYSDLLRKHSKWSVSSYTYQYGTFLYAQLVDDRNAGKCPPDSDLYHERLEQIRNIMLQVPNYRIRYAGKTPPAEKFAIERSLKFVQHPEGDEQLCLPALEFLYVWNIFVTLRNSPEQVDKILGHINTNIARHMDDSRKETEPHEEDYRDDQWHDDLNLMRLLKGMCLKHLNRLDEAEKCFTDVIGDKDNIAQDTFLVPHCTMEMALLNLSKNRFEESRQWIRTTRNDYSGYLLETLVHFRLHAASRAIRLELEQEQ